MCMYKYKSLEYKRKDIRCVLSKWDYFVKKENLILGLKIKTRTNKEEQKININYLYK